MYKNSTQATTLGYCQERIIVRCICVFQKSLDNLYIYNLSD